MKEIQMANIRLKDLIKEEVTSNAHVTAGEMISQVGLYTQQNAESLKSSKSSNLYRFFDTAQEESEIIKISEEYKGYLTKLKAAVDALMSDPLYQVAVGDAGGRYRDKGIGETLQKAYNRASNINNL